MTTLKELERTHDLDIAQIIASWLTSRGIGGDPGPESVVVEVDETTRAMAATLAAHLAETYGSAPLSLEAFKKGAERLGASVERYQRNPDELVRDRDPRPHCVKLHDEWICYFPRPVGYQTHA